MANPDRDDELLDELRRLADQVDPVPLEVTSYAKAALGWRRLDADLAELRSDSVLEATPAFARSGEAPARSLAFGAGDLEIGLEVAERDSGVLLLGQLAPPGRAAVEVQRDDSTTLVAGEADELGRFRLELAERGRVRLVVRRESPVRPVETSWFGI